MNPKPLKRDFILDDLEADLEDALLHDPAQRQHDAMIAHIRLRRDPEDLAVAPLFEREELRENLRDLRDALELSQSKLGKEVGLSRATLSRLENLERKGSYLPHRSTLRKMAELCRRRGWPERAETLEKAAGWERRHRYAERPGRHCGT